MQPGAAWDFVKSNLVEGCVPDYSDDSDKNRVVISRSMADALNLGVDDRINAYFSPATPCVRRLDIAEYMTRISAITTSSMCSAHCL